MMKNLQKLEDFLVENKPKYFDKFEVEVLPKRSKYVQSKIFGNYFKLNECVSFIISDIFSGVTIQNLEDVLV